MDEIEAMEAMGREITAAMFRAKDIFDKLGARPYDPGYDRDVVGWTVNVYRRTEWDDGCFAMSSLNDDSSYRLIEKIFFHTKEEADRYISTHRSADRDMERVPVFRRVR